MSLQERVIVDLKERRNNLLSGKVNCIPSPFVRFREDFVGFEQGNSVTISSFTKGGKTQFTLYLLFEALLFAYNNPDRLRLKVFYYPLEETPEQILNRFMSWLLLKLKGIRISPRDLRSTIADRPVPQEIIDVLESNEFKVYLDFFENVFVFSSTSNPTGVYYECKKYAEENGVVHKKNSGFNESEVFDYYEPNDPFEYKIIVIDHISLIDAERGMNKKEAIDKLGEYLDKYLKNRYGFTPITIQQQNSDVESNDSFKLQRIRPSVLGLSDSKYTARNTNIMLGLFSPFKFGLKEYMGYDITKFKDNIRFLEVVVNRNGTVGGIVALYFDGATCTFEELPEPNNKEALARYYQSSMPTIHTHSNSLFTLFNLFKLH